MTKKPKKLVRVTSVLSFVESSWKEYWWRSVGFDAADKIGRESASFGTSVHETVESILKGEVHNFACPENVGLCAAAILEYLEKNNIKPLFETYEKSLEIEVKDKKLGLVGHFDMAALVDGVPTIVDFKTSNKMRKSFPLQMAAYARMARSLLKADINNGLCIRAHWDKDSKAVEFETATYADLMKVYWPKFKAALEVYHYFNGTK